MESRKDPNGTISVIKTFNHIKQHGRKLQDHPNIIDCDNISNIYKCQKCDFETNFKVSLKIHINLNHKEDSNNENQFITVMRQCGFCDFQTYSTLVLLKHHLECHERNNLLTDASCEVISWLECSQCSFKTEWKMVLKQHITILHTTNRVSYSCECDKCEHKAESEADLNQHITKVHQQHIAILHTEPTDRVCYICDKCGDKAKSEADLNLHMTKVHQQNIAILHTKPPDRVCYSCDKCGHKAETEAHLNQHITNVHQTNVREIIRNNEDVVNFLLEGSGFSNLAYDEQCFLKQLGRPTPSLNNLLNIYVNASNRKFCTSWYQRCKWLTGSEVKNKLYCWTCLLFNPPDSRSPWHTTGVDNMKTLYRTIERHGVSKEHTYSALKYQLFGASIQKSIDSAHQDSVIRHNEKVKENRDILRRLINMTIYLATQQLESDGCHNEKDESQSQGNFRELAELLSSYDSKFEEFLKSSSVFSEMSKTIQDDLVDSVNHVLLESIESEILNSVCFSWEIDETCQSQLSVVFRYTHEGDIVERFLGFFDIGASGRTVVDLFNFLSQRFKKFNLKDKLVGQTYDGASVMSGYLNELQLRIKRIAPRALFTHCYAHRLNLILQDSVSSIQECKIFFATVSGMSNFFSSSTKRTNVLDDVCNRRRVPCYAQTRSNFKSRIVNTVLVYREELLEAFQEITQSSDFAKDSTSIRESALYIDFLKNFNNLFLLNVFSLIFQQTDLIYSIIQSRSNDITYCKFRIEKLLETIKSFRKNERHFRHMYDNTVNVLGKPTKIRKSDLPDSVSDVTLHYRRLYYELLDLIIAQIQDRFAEFEKLQIFDLLNSEKFASFEKHFPHDLLHLLVVNYPKFFNKDKLEMELKILYSEATILGESAELRDMLKFISANSLQDYVPEIFKLLSLILSLPVTSASVDPSFSALKRIENYVRNSVSQSRNLSLIAIEREMVKSLQKSSNFFDRVIDHFAKSKNRGIELFYKNL